MAKKNWDIIRKQKDTETVKYRDVYEDQQLERGSIAEKQTMTGRIILSAGVAAFAGILTWMIMSYGQMYTMKDGLDDDADPRDDYIFVEEHYENVTNNTDVLTVDEYNEWYDIYHSYNHAQDDDIDVPDIAVDDLEAFLGEYDYDYEDNTYHQGFHEISFDEYDEAVQTHLQEYLTNKEAYDLYYKQHTDPEKREDDPDSGNYVKVVAHYKNLNNLDEFLLPDAYETAVAAYEARKENKEITEDLLNIPLKPIDYSLIYEGSEHTYVKNRELWEEMKVDNPELLNAVSKEDFEQFLEYCDDKHIKLIESPYPLTGMEIPNTNDAKVAEEYKKYQDFYNSLKSVFASYKKTTYGDYWQLFEQYCAAAHYDRNEEQYVSADSYTCIPTVYRNRFDGSVISRLEYAELTNKYNQDLATYNSDYLIHRRSFHPDDVDGTLAVLRLGPNSSKVTATFVITMVAFSLLYFFLSKNLKAQNLLSDTSDINQYHNDQHIALPEETQKNYDWFPDVGAHSSVQVSSMISHMAIMNKGLKNVALAKRANKDIKDENGDIEYFKGEILLDKDGNPISNNVPIIDTEFMEALFDASGAPKDKKVRHYYDTTKIPYNPGNENRDKLPGYDTVADLINKDWEFPIYEPQRPAGAYIVDTAPVNTIKYSYHVINA